MIERVMECLSNINSGRSQGNFGVELMEEMPFYSNASTNPQLEQKLSSPLATVVLARSSKTGGSCVIVN